MRIWLQARPPGAAEAHAGRRRRARSTSRTRSSPPARSGQAPTGGEQELVYTITTKGRLADAEGVRADHRARQPRRLDAAPEGRGARRARLQGLRVHRPRQRQAGDAGRHLPAARRQRARRRRRRVERTRWRELAQRFPQGLDVRDPVRHHALRRGVDPRGGEDARRGDGAGVPGGVPVPAELARDADPVRRGAGVADRHVRRPATCSATRSTR